MISLTDRAVNTLITIPCKITGIIKPVDTTLIKEGALDLTTVNFVYLATPGLGVFSFTPTTTGTYYLFSDGIIQASIDVNSKSIRSYLVNIEDEALGSWTWDKTTGALTMLKQDGGTLANFEVVDTLTESSRERI